MISENIQMFLVWFWIILQGGVVGYGISYSIGTMLLGIILKIEIQEKVELKIVKAKEKNGR